MRFTASAHLVVCACNSEDATIFQCLGASLKTAVSQLQRNINEVKTGVAELTTYSRQNNATGNLSKMISI